jgi:hypothetical protein
MLMRLPALGPTEGKEESRVFIDSDFLAACQAGDVIEFCTDPYAKQWDSLQWLSAVDEMGIMVATYLASIRQLAPRKLYAALGVSAERSGNLAADIARVIAEMGSNIKQEVSVFIREANIPCLELSDRSGDLSKTHFQSCGIESVQLDVSSSDGFPFFEDCTILTLEGRHSKDDLPSDRFIRSEPIEFLTVVDTNAAILDSSLPAGVKVLIVSLRKLFIQSGRARKENAFHKGLEPGLRGFVPEVLRLIQKSGIAARHKSSTKEAIYIPAAEAQGRALRIIAAPTESKDPIVREAALLGHRVAE